MNIVEKRRSMLINFAFYALLIAAYYFFMKFAFWLVAPFIAAFLIAMFLQKNVFYLGNKYPNSAIHPLTYFAKDAIIYDAH